MGVQGYVRVKNAVWLLRFVFTSGRYSMRAETVPRKNQKPHAAWTFAESALDRNRELALQLGVAALEDAMESLASLCMLSTVRYNAFLMRR